MGADLLFEAGDVDRKIGRLARVLAVLLRRTLSDCEMPVGVMLRIRREIRPDALSEARDAVEFRLEAVAAGCPPGHVIHGARVAFPAMDLLSAETVPGQRAQMLARAMGLLFSGLEAAVIGENARLRARRAGR